MTSSFDHNAASPRHGASLPPVRPPRWPWLVGAALLGGGLLFTPPIKRAVYRLVDRFREEKVVYKEKIVVKEKIVEKIKEVRVPVNPTAGGLEGQSMGGKKEVTALFAGIQVRAAVSALNGGLASKERVQASSYEADFQVKIKVPKPSTTMLEFQAVNPALPVVFPGLAALLPTAKVSGFYQQIYTLKQAAIKKNILQLDRVPTRHNFFDLESALELEHPESKQKALFLQGEMDVVSDGSDGDRMENFDMAIYRSHHFQPSTSYSWTKQTDKENPLIPCFQEDMEEAKAQLRAPDLTTAEKTKCQRIVSDATTRIADLKRRSYLIASEDPFVVIPLSMKDYKGTAGYRPEIGDYAIVLCDEKAYPAIVGDYGPAIKCGEASLRLAREVNPKAGPYVRAISDLRVSYIIFPDSAEKPFRAPSYTAWHASCSVLFKNLGGDPVRLHVWEDRIKLASEAKAKAAAEALRLSTPAVVPAPVPSPTPAVR